MEFMNDQRIAVVHKQGAKTQEEISMVPLAHALTHSPLYAAYGDTGAPGALAPEIGQNVYYFEINGQREKAVDWLVISITILPEPHAVLSLESVPHFVPSLGRKP